jgi:hypothetical protein
MFKAGERRSWPTFNLERLNFLTEHSIECDPGGSLFIALRTRISSRHFVNCCERSQRSHRTAGGAPWDGGAAIGGMTRRVVMINNVNTHRPTNRTLAVIDGGINVKAAGRDGLTD